MQDNYYNDDGDFDVDVDGECENNDDVNQSGDDDENLVPRQVKPIKQPDQLGSEIFL